MAPRQPKAKASTNDSTKYHDPVKHPSEKSILTIYRPHKQPSIHNHAHTGRKETPRVVTTPEKTKSSQNGNQYHPQNRHHRHNKYRIINGNQYTRTHYSTQHITRTHTTTTDTDNTNWSTTLRRIAHDATHTQRKKRAHEAELQPHPKATIDP
mmetsp:Transcript_17408/g.26604  ORF Transcript_17408/g.26604 Transcript_17408/m.26604 type:complete len:153 (-) Transcript_17408:145-603(-)